MPRRNNYSDHFRFTFSRRPTICTLQNLDTLPWCGAVMMWENLQQEFGWGKIRTFRLLWNTLEYQTHLSVISATRIEHANLLYTYVYDVILPYYV